MVCMLLQDMHTVSANDQVLCVTDRGSVLKMAQLRRGVQRQRGPQKCFTHGKDCNFLVVGQRDDIMPSSPAVVQAVERPLCTISCTHETSVLSATLSFCSASRSHTRALVTAVPAGNVAVAATCRASSLFRPDSTCQAALGSPC